MTNDLINRKPISRRLILSSKPMIFVPREFGVNPEVFDRSGKSAGREKTTELDRNSTKGARDVYLSTRTIFGKSRRC